MKEVYTSKEKCCGCSACRSVCPRRAVTMTADEQGFLYPKIDESICIDCGLCKQVCAFQNGYPASPAHSPLAFAVKSRDGGVRSFSSSGGMFTEISNYILKNSGVVYAAAFSADFIVRHKRACTQEERNQQRSSKYIQSDLGSVFEDIKKDLKTLKPVLFVGTACQVQGLKAYLKQDYENLLLCDLVCHGVPSPRVFEDYKTCMEKKYRSKIRSFSFRAKKLPGSTQDIEMVFQNGKQYNQYGDLDLFGGLFSRNYGLRPSCYQCIYTNLNRPGDITIGDFWGIEKSLPGFDDHRGVSLLLLNTPKGTDIFDKIKKDLTYRESNLDSVLQPNLIRPSKKPEDLENFWRDYFNKGFFYTGKKYVHPSMLKKYKRIFMKRRK